MSSLLSIGKSGLLAAQVGLSTTGNNITNAGVVGYSRQTVLQGATAPQGQRFARGASGFLAHVFQHEMDHLDGVLYTDKATKTYDEEKDSKLQDYILDLPEQPYWMIDKWQEKE